MLNFLNIVLEMPKRIYLISTLLAIAITFKYIHPSSIAISYFVWFAVLIGSIPLIIESTKAVLKFKITIEVFNLFALGIALLLNNTFAALWIELMLLFASYLEWKTKNKARNAIEELLKLAPEIAHRQLRNDEYEDIQVQDLKTNNIVLVKNGEKVPVDGVIVFGNGVFDESSFTGESIPQEKYINDKVFTATVLKAGVVKIKATHVGENTSFSRMVSLMKQALKSKSNLHRFADVFATLFLPTVAIAAIIIYLTTKDAVIVAAFLVIVCADDIAVAIPLAMEAAFGKAASMGVIVKGGVYFEKLAKTKIVVFDKTGTLTHSKIKIDNFLISNNISEQDFWKYVSIAEKFSEHPIGLAIYKNGIKYNSNIPDPKNVKVLVGAGVVAESDNNRIIIGNIKAIEEYGISVDNNIVNNDTNSRGKITLYVAINEMHVGLIYLSDSVKDNAIETISKLKTLKIKTIMLTGDKRDVAERISKELGLDEVHSELSPEDKLNIIINLSKSGSVVMVGDGVNDAPSLARADVGIAMGEMGMAASIEAADVVIQTDNLIRVYDVIVLARKVRRVVYNNFIIWFITNTIGTILVLTKIANIPIAAFYNFLSDFIPLFNSAWLFKGNKPKNQKIHNNMSQN